MTAPNSQPHQPATTDRCLRAVAVGLTGGIGAGKSTALSFFRDLGAHTISADEMVHRLYAQPETKNRIAEHFGSEVLNDRGEVDRARLARAVRAHREELRWLEQLVHPLVAAELRRSIAVALPGSILVCEVPLLFESGLEGLFDLIVTIEANAQNRRSRSVQGFDLGMFSELEQLQASTRDRVRESDLSFTNDGDIERLHDFVEAAYRCALALCGRNA